MDKETKDYIDIGDSKLLGELDVLEFRLERGFTSLETHLGVHNSLIQSGDKKLGILIQKVDDLNKKFDNKFDELKKLIKSRIN